MGFFSSLFNIDIPHRQVGMMAKDYCIKLSASDKEVNLLKRFRLSQERFIPARNALLVQMFNLFFMLVAKQTANYPDATVRLAETFFQQRVVEYYDSLQEPEKLRMQEIHSAAFHYADLESSAEHLYLAVSGMEFDSLSPEQKVEFKEFVNDYVKDIAVFFKKNSPSLLK